MDRKDIDEAEIRRRYDKACEYLRAHGMPVPEYCGKGSVDIKPRANIRPFVERGDVPMPPEVHILEYDLAFGSVEERIEYQRRFLYGPAERFFE